MTSAAGDPRARKTRARALAAAERLLMSEGLARVTFDGVRKETGISRSTLYRHWSRPIDLVVEAWERNTRLTPLPDTEDVRSDLIAAMNSTVDFLQNNLLGGSVSALIDMASHDPDLARLHASFTAERRRPAIARVRRAIGAGELRANTDPEQIIDLLFGPIFYRHLLSHQQTTTTYVEQLADTVISAATTTNQPVPTNRKSSKSETTRPAPHGSATQA